MSQTALPGLGLAPIDSARDRSFAVDRTPLPVVRQILQALNLEFDDGEIDGDHYGQKRAVRILDIGCGEGAWGQVARELWPRANIVGIEPRREALAHARRHYNLVLGGGFEDWDGLRQFDLVMGNPPFSAFGEGGRRINLFPSLIAFGLEALDEFGVLCLYGLDDLGQRGRTTIDVFARTPPSQQLRVTGSIAHRGPKRDDVEGSGAGDSRCYSAWVWYREDLANGSTGVGWSARNLPLLSADDRRWVEIPGTGETQHE